MTKSKLQREHRTPRVPEQHWCRQLKMLPQPVEILQIRRQRDLFRANILSRLSASALVIVNEPVRISEMIKFRPQIRVVEIRSTVKHDDRASAPDVTDVKRRIAGRHPHFTYPQPGSPFRVNTRYGPTARALL